MELMNETIETSMSTFGTFQRCSKAFWFKEALLWEPRSVSKAAQIGTLFHACMAKGLNALREYWPNIQHSPQLITECFLAFAPLEAYKIERDRNGLPLDLDQGDRETVEDMVRFYWQEYGAKRYSEDVAEILFVEEPCYIQIGRYLIRNTFDALVRLKSGGEEIEDYKTVDDPREGKEWLAQDFQTRSYMLSARGRFNRLVPFRHTFVRRGVPPGFGHCPLTTASGKKRSTKELERMQDPAGYIQTLLSSENNIDDAALDHFEKKLVLLVAEAERTRTLGIFHETTIKAGPFSCGNCAYQQPCALEIQGRDPREGFNDLNYIVRGSEEWNALEAQAQ